MTRIRDTVGLMIKSGKLTSMVSIQRHQLNFLRKREESGTKLTKILILIAIGPLQNLGSNNSKVRIPRVKDKGCQISKDSTSNTRTNSSSKTQVPHMPLGRTMSLRKCHY